MATRWTRIAAIAAAGCLIAGAALAQQNIDPPNKRAKPGPPNQPEPAPSHFGPPLEQPPKEAPKAVKRPKPPKDPNKRPRKGEAGPESRGNDASDALGKPGSTD